MPSPSWLQVISGAGTSTATVTYLSVRRSPFAFSSPISPASWQHLALDPWGGERALNTRVMNRGGGLVQRSSTIVFIQCSTEQIATETPYWHCKLLGAETLLHLTGHVAGISKTTVKNVQTRLMGHPCHKESPELPAAA